MFTRMRTSVLLGLLFWALTAHGLIDTVSVSDDLRQRLQSNPTRLAAGETRLHNAHALVSLYARRDFAPLWLSDDQVLPAADLLVAAVVGSVQDGLNPQDYHRQALQGALAMAGGPLSVRQLASLELLLSDAFLELGGDLVSGRLDPKKIDRKWPFERRQLDLGQVLEQAAAEGTVAAALAGLAPRYDSYRRLKDALARYRVIRDSGGWQRLGTGRSLKPGIADDRIKALRARLRTSGDLSAAVAAPPPPAVDNDAVYDDEVIAAVIRFQKRHGLETDGVVGPKTLAALNVPVEQRIRQLELNLERWRWLPASLGERYILVNIPGFEMSVFEHDRPVFSSPVIVGRTDRKTPLLSSTIDRLVLSPYWNVPRSIAVRDKLPKLRRNPYAFKSSRLRVFSSSGREVDPGRVNWRGLGRGNFPYRLRQDPGPKNALGKVKFLFPNPYSVYLHDTSSPRLFQKDRRAFSSGCVRVAKPLELAEFLLSRDPAWDRARIDAAANSRRERAVELDQDMPVHLLYWTAWQADDGSVQFREDIYSRDQRLRKTLFARR